MSTDRWMMIYLGSMRVWLMRRVGVMTEVRRHRAGSALGLMDSLKPILNKIHAPRTLVRHSSLSSDI